MTRNPQPLPSLTVLASGLDEAGAGTATIDGSLIHVVGLLPGERGTVDLEHVSPHRAEAWGHLRERLGPVADDRVAPACPAAGRCGGCAWQHLAYPAQLAHKRDRVRAALAGVVAVDVVAPVVAAPAPLGYRNRGKYVAGERDGALVLGGFAPRSHDLIDTAGCQVVAPIIDEVAAWAVGAGRAADVRPFRERQRTGDLRYVVVRCNPAGDVLLGLVTPTTASAERIATMADALARHPAVRGVVHVQHDRTDGAILPHDATTTTLRGEPCLRDEVAGVQIETGIAEFLQVNHAQAAAMYGRIAALAAVGPGQRAVDLYAGVGGISFALARRGAAVHAIEVDRGAVAALAAAAARAGLTQVTALAGDASLLAAAAVDVIVVNPPRKGLSEAACQAVLAAGAPTLIYVSCGPESLGRDLGRWAAAGYVVDTVEPFDLMPGTGHVETVVRAQRVTQRAAPSSPP